MATFGSACLLIGLALAAYNLLAGAVALRLIATGQPATISPERLADTARRAGIAGFIAVSGAAFALVWAAFTNDFSITYITEHSNRALPLAYKFSALWSGQEGSLLLWAWLLGTYGFILRLRHKTDVKLYAYAGTILAGVQVFFLLILNFAAPPFSLLPGYVAGGAIPALEHAIRNRRGRQPIEIEVRSLEELYQALDHGAEAILLDHVSVEHVRKAVEICSSHQRRIPLECAGGINLENVRSYAETGVDFISVGALTQSSTAVDMSLRVTPA